MSADFAFQKAIYRRLTGAAEVIALVPASSIVDENHRAGPMPLILIGEGMAMEGNRIDRRDERIVLDLHLWKREPGLAGVKAIAGAVVEAVKSGKLEQTDGYHIADCRVTRRRFLRDPDGETAHGIVWVEALVCEVA